MILTTFFIKVMRDQTSLLTTISTFGGINVETGTSESTIVAENGQTPGTLLNKINNQESSGANIINMHQGGGGGGVIQITHQNLLQQYLLEEVMLRLVLHKLKYLW